VSVCEKEKKRVFVGKGEIVCAWEGERLCVVCV